MCSTSTEIQGYLSCNADFYDGKCNMTYFLSLVGDKVSMLTQTYEHKPPRNIEVTICNHQAGSPLCVWPDV